MSGDYPGNATRKQRAALAVVPLVSEVVGTVFDHSNGSDVAADPGSIRPALAQLAAANLDALQRALLEAALSATTTRWATVSCGECGARSRVELPVLDTRARLQAIETLLAQGLGRPGQAEEPSVPRLPRSIDAVKQMGWEEMRYVFATIYAGEIEAVVREGGEQALRERVGRLGQPERTLLLNALASA